MRPLDMRPTTDAEVFDMLHGLFGIGDYSPDDDKPWHHFRMVEIARIKAIRKKRRWSFDDFALVARYCYRHRVTVNRAWDLLKHYGLARVEALQNERSRRDLRIEEAVNAERAAALPDSDEWIARLELSAGPGREAVLEEWRTTRQRVLTA